METLTDGNNTITNSSPNQGTIVTYAIYDNTEGFLKSKINSVWGNAGYTTQNTERSTVWKVLGDFHNGMISHILNLNNLLKGDFKSFLKGIGGGFRTTRYFHHYIQNVAPINGQYIPDQVQTYSAIANTRKENIAESVQRALRTGRGYNLKRYYQYHNRRYKNRQWNWQAYKTKNVSIALTKFNEQNFLNQLASKHKDRRFKIIDVTKEFTESGQLFLDTLNQKYGVNTFGNPFNDSYKPTGLEKSRGVTVWSSPKDPSLVRTIQLDNYITTEKLTKLSRIIQVGDTQTFTILKVFDNPYDMDDNDPLKDTNLDDTSIDVKNGEVIVEVTVTLVQEDTLPDGKKQRTYSLEEKQMFYFYDKEEHFYITESGSTNYPNFDKFWTSIPPKYKVNEKLTNKDSKVFKFFGHLPIRDWKQGNNNTIQTLPRLGKENGIVKAIRTLNDLTDKAFREKEEEVSDSSVKGKRTSNKLQRGNPKKDGKSSYKKLKSNKESKTNNNARSIQRFITRELNNDRKLEFNRDILSDVKDYPPKRLKRHIEYLSELIGINYMQYCAGLVGQDIWEGAYNKTPNTMQANIMLGAIFSNQTKESHDYWYEWAKRQYKLAGKENSFEEWKALVDSANSLQELPQQVVKYQSAEGTMWGGFSFCFIRKLTIKGRTRRIRHKHRLRDILRGKPQTIGSIAHLKQMVEPLQMLADDTYYYHPVSKKEYPIGGEGFAGSGTTESGEPTLGQVFQNYSYTFFAKNSGKDEITCYAICGLQFHTKMEDRWFWASAWYDLGLEFERLKQKYIDKKGKGNIDICFSTEKGSRKHRYINKIYNFGLVPIEYDVVKRMNAVNLENFAQRAPLAYSFLHVELKGKRKGMKYLKPVITIVGFIISVIMTMWGQAWTWALFAKAVAIATVVSIVVNIAVTKVLVPLLKMLGLKGIVGMIILIIILIIAAFFTGGKSLGNLPYAANAGKEVAKEATVQASKEVVQQTTQEAIKQTLVDIQKEVVAQLIGNSLASIGANAIKYLSSAYMEISNQQIADIQKQIQQENEQYQDAMAELEERQLEMQESTAQFDARAVLEAFKDNVVKIKDLDLYRNNALQNENTVSTYEFLKTFLDFKLTLEPEHFNPITSTDFTFKTT